MKYRLKMTKKAKGDFLILEKKDQERIAKKLRFYMHQGNPLKFAKKLVSPTLGTYRFRIGEYRAIFDLDKNRKITILLILRIKHRKEVYLN